MKITVTHPYLVFPVNLAKSMKKLLFTIGDELVYEADVRLDTHNPDFYAYFGYKLLQFIKKLFFAGFCQIYILLIVICGSIRATSYAVFQRLLLICQQPCLLPQ